MPGAVYRTFAVRVWCGSKEEPDARIIQQPDHVAPQARSERKETALWVQVWGSTPGETNPGEPERVTYSPDLFVRKDASGEPVNLLDQIKDRQGGDAVLYQVGAILAELIFPKAVRSNFLASRRKVKDVGERLRLRLVLQVPELKSLPWEYLYLPPKEEICDPSGFLALDQDISIVRHEDIGGEEPSTPHGGKYRLVAAFAGPDGQPKLNLEGDREAIAAALEAISKNSKGVIVSTAWGEQGTREELERLLKGPCDVFHFSGHGYFWEGEGSLLLVGADRKSEKYEGSKLAQLLGDAKVKVAILEACESAERGDNPYGGVAAALVLKGLAAVVASQYRLRDKNAVAIAKAIYPRLLSGETIDHCIFQARKSIFQQSALGDRDWGALVLYLRGDQGVVFPQQETEDRKVSAPCIEAPPLQMPLIGRADQLEQLAAQVKPGVNLFLHGNFGVGKTSLAAQLFNQVSTSAPIDRGRIWHRLGKTTPERAIESLARLFPGQKVSEADGLAAKTEAFKALLASFPGLLIGLDEVSDQTIGRAVLDATNGCAVMMNGTAPLKLNGVQDVKVKPLSAEAARELFLSLCQVSAADLNKADLILVDKICKRMGRLPLGIRLAASKCAEGDSYKTLWLRLETAPETISNDEVQVLFKANYDELASLPCAQRLLVRIASFPALEASFAALQAGEKIKEFFPAKDKLISLGLLDAIGPDRLSQHPLLAEHGNPALDREQVASERRYAEQWLEKYARDNRKNHPMLEKEQDNLLGLLDDFVQSEEPGHLDRVIATLRNLFDFLRIRGLWSEAFEKIDACLSSEQYLSDENRGWAFLHRAILHTLLARYDDALSDLVRAAQRFECDGDSVNLGRALYRRGVVHVLKGDLMLADQDLRDGIAHMSFDPLLAGADLAGAFARQGAVLAQQGRRTEAQEAYRRSLRLAEQIGDDEEQTRAHLGRGAMNQATDPAQALADFDQARRLAEKTGDQIQRASILHLIGCQHYYSEHYEKAQACFADAMRLFQQFGYQNGIAKCLVAFGNLALAERRYDEARRNYEQAIELNTSLKQAGAAAYATYQLAVVAQRDGRLDDAERGYDECQKYAHAEKDRVLEAAVAAQRAKLMLQRDKPQAAALLARKASDLAKALDDKLTQITASSALAVVLGTLKQEGAQEAMAAAATARATIKGVEGELQSLSDAKTTTEISDRIFNSELPAPSSPDRIPDRIIANEIPDRVMHDLTYDDSDDDGGGLI
ncbi:hypothetical protein UNPF46_18575 [Bradyrhizobium sp. UNPF46]|uniref:CHAT domain-containing protein n=1 Tax=Bradyrhizobium sp. UNPF46 TaxID=1141168 RepID=UPI0011532B5E|nr:CHAT domain-containing protein [Bradyrhizobium sp. UNPF46]TQF37721.1 hypothetical protein UNPF46_18575 [Bradyrhizobium sp. UNPF46]